MRVYSTIHRLTNFKMDYVIFRRLGLKLRLESGFGSGLVRNQLKGVWVEGGLAPLVKEVAAELGGGGTFKGT